MIINVLLAHYSWQAMTEQISQTKRGLHEQPISLLHIILIAMFPSYIYVPYMFIINLSVVEVAKE